MEILKNEKCLTIIKEKIKNIKSKNLELEPSPKSKYEKFIRKSTLIENGSFKYDDIVGTDHIDYQNMNWIEAFSSLKRQSNKNIDCEDNTKNKNIYYYKSSQQKSNWFIRFYNNKGYIHEGNHRTIIGKLLYEIGLIEQEQKGVKIEINEVDMNIFEKFDTFKKEFENLPKIIKDKFEINDNDTFNEIFKVKKELQSECTLNKGKIIQKYKNYFIFKKLYYEKNHYKQIIIEEKYDDIDSLLIDFTERIQYFFNIHNLNLNIIIYKFKQFINKKNYFNI